MAALPFTEDIEDLLRHMEDIPVDGDVRFAQAFMELLKETGGNPWGPQASERSKLATRLWFAGWSRAQLEQVGLKPKDVENFRRTHGLTAGAVGRPSKSIKGTSKVPPTALREPVLAIRYKIQHLMEERRVLVDEIAQKTDRIADIDAELKKWEAIMEMASE